MHLYVKHNRYFVICKIFLKYFSFRFGTWLNKVECIYKRATYQLCGRILFSIILTSCGLKIIPYVLLKTFIFSLSCNVSLHLLLFSKHNFFEFLTHISCINVQCTIGYISANTRRNS